MKTIISMLSLSIAVILTACGNNSSSEQTAEKKNDSTAQTTTNNTEIKKSGSPNEIVAAYLELKNALANDNGNEAASAAKNITTAIANVDESTLAADQKKAYADVKDDIREHAEHIGSNSSNIAHQRGCLGE